jgi:hypothetical protein
MTNSQAQYIRDNYTKMTDFQISKVIKIPVERIGEWRRENGLVKKKQTKWSDDETAIIRANLTTPIDILCQLLPHRDYHQVKTKRQREACRPEVEAEQPRAVLDWTQWRPSVTPVQFDDGLKQAVKVQSMLMALGVR